MNLAGQLWERCSPSSSSDTPRTLSRYAAGAGAGGSSRERERTFLRTEGWEAWGTCCFPPQVEVFMWGGIKRVGGPGSIPAVPLRPESPGGLVSEQAKPEPIVINGSVSHQGPISPQANCLTPTTPGIKTPICWPWLGARWAEDRL